jgi:hypothetical protein
MISLKFLNVSLRPQNNLASISSKLSETSITIDLSEYSSKKSLSVLSVGLYLIFS